MHRGKEAIRAHLRGYGYDMDDTSVKTMRDAIEPVLSQKKSKEYTALERFFIEIALLNEDK